ncbi:TPA: integrating conjugative element protein [Salmonella enterica subsp. diarizonae serovar 50:r:z]|nr:integrating conjugative element protein [Salmonella enterica]EDQ6554747.1 integrating conjugative element protein [Salmonella enterica subsp. enterica]EGE4753612.1 integrating conjugative element protein [Salmonella enterica subsp. diarizonae serovar 38:[k]:z35]HBJ6316871.1 integrating conjugative element protein [Salmonella enterica subsp. diarizonae serovar 50:r:z]EBT4079751.1 integrating conjugative element protein [Salmonella enterica]
MQYIHSRILRHFRALYPAVRYTLLPVTLAGLLTTSAMAALTVVADLGGESTTPLFDAVNNETNEFTPPRTLTPSPSVSPVTVDEMLPVSTPEMTPGRVENRRSELTGMTPVFLVGDDALSRRWLEQRRGDLQRLHATGLVVNVTDGTALRDLQALAPGLTLLPASASDIARRLGLAHYPVLITADGLSQ